MGQPKENKSEEGSALILALVMIMVGTLMVLPVMEYTMSVIRANRITSDISDRTEAVKAGLRVALYDTVALYQACEPSKTGPTISVNLAAPPDLGIRTWCTSTGTQSQNLPTDQRWALTTTQAGSEVWIPEPHAGEIERTELNGTISPTWCTSMSPPDNDPNKKTPCGTEYPLNGNVDTLAWQSQTSTVTTKDTIFFPPLPPVSNNLSFAGGYPMPVGSGDTPCTVYFPGKYTDDVVITGSTPVYFVSGIYYFEKAFRVSGNADIVVGSGSSPGCVESDAVAVADALGAPFDAHSSGVGGTFVFGAAGRLIIDTATASTTGASLKFNRRLVETSDPLAVLNDISIMSATGVYGAGVTTGLTRPGELEVPVTPVFNGTTTDLEPWTHRYKASTLIPAAATPSAPCAPPPAVAATTCPVIDINLTTDAKVTLKVPGYVSIAQGAFSLSVMPGAGVSKNLSFGGGILAAQMVVPGEAAESLQLGLLNPVVQLILKITTETISSTPRVTSVAHVQVNETGGYAVNSWVVQSSCGTRC